ncbi:MAG: GNAT family N-acetyltransferase [Nocardioidaceae bacterium]|nr:GNAT family N-acetyltransferase [Nocardioidaceae bacterium]
MSVNEFGQPLGEVVEGWEPRARPERVTLEGRYVRLVPLSSAHYSDLYAATCGPDDRQRWTYLPAEAPTDLPGLWMLMTARLEADPTTYVIVAEGGRPAGVFSLCSVDAANGSIEIGWVLFGAALQRTRAATEAIHLLQAYAFDELGYRRLEWKCDSRNEPSRRAAERFGFTYEGRFRNHRVVKGCNRDSDWFSITDAEWPALRQAHEAWLEPANFDADGRQVAPLRRHAPEVTAPSAGPVE